MISFGYLKLTFVISMAFIRYAYHLWINYVHVQIERSRWSSTLIPHAFLRRCFDDTVFLK